MSDQNTLGDPDDWGNSMYRAWEQEHEGLQDPAFLRWKAQQTPPALACPKCDFCVTCNHHWFIDLGQQQQVVGPYTYSCKHCPAQAVTCPGCQGDYDSISAEDWCDLCDGFGVIPVTDKEPL